MFGGFIKTYKKFRKPPKLILACMTRSKSVQIAWILMILIKTKLQEISQQKFNKLPEYKLIKKTGSPHSPVFTVSLKIFKMKLVKASGKSKKEAQKEAAKIILNLISAK